MVPTICSNNECGSYDAAGIKNICGKCFREWFDGTTKSNNEEHVLEKPVFAPFCSNEKCGSYDAAGIKNMCGKCFKEWFNDNNTRSKIESRVLKSPIFDLCSNIASITLTNSTITKKTNRCKNSNKENQTLDFFFL